MTISQLFNDFAGEIRGRRGILTEDSLRYIFFACMLRQDSALNNYTLELPYRLLMPSNNTYPIFINLQPTQTGRLGDELDLYYEDSVTPEIFCIEFKFHRAGTRNSTLNYTASAGSIIKDIKRLQLIQSSGNPVHRLLVYVTDDKMHNYLSASGNVYRDTLSAFYLLPQGNSSTFIFNPSNVPAAFINAAAHSSLAPIAINVKKQFDSHFSTPCPSFASGRAHIVIYEVM